MIARHYFPWFIRFSRVNVRITIQMQIAEQLHVRALRFIWRYELHSWVSEGRHEKKKQTPARKADNNETCVQRRRDMKPLSPRITDSLIFALSRRSIEWNIFNHSPRESVEKYLCINCERTNCIVWVGRERQLIRVMYVIVLLHVYVLLRSEWAIWVVKLKYVHSFTYCVVTYGVSDFQRRISLNSKNGTIEIT